MRGGSRRPKSRTTVVLWCLGLLGCVVAGIILVVSPAPDAVERWKMSSSELDAFVRHYDQVESVDCRAEVRDESVHRWRCKVVEGVGRRGTLLIWIKKDGSVSSRARGVRGLTMQGGE